MTSALTQPRSDTRRPCPAAHARTATRSIPVPLARAGLIRRDAAVRRPASMPQLDSQIQAGNVTITNQYAILRGSMSIFARELIGPTPERAASPAIQTWPT